MPNGDGLVLRGHRLYVVQTFLNRVTVIKLSSDLRRGTITGFLTSPEFDVPTTATLFGGHLYVVNARFGTPITPETEYNVVRVKAH